LIIGWLQPGNGDGSGPLGQAGAAGAGPGLGENQVEAAPHHAAEGGSLDAIRLLIASGADLNVKNTAGKTPLAVSKHHDQPSTTELLMDAGGR